MSFLGALADQLSSQYSLGENTTHSLDSVVNGQNIKYGSLGNFASKIDQSAERKYLEEGYLRLDPYNTDSKHFEILMQQPEATVLVKKRMFSSIGENYRPDFMDSDEKLYYKTIKVLFQNKCNQIGALEKLSKIQKIASIVGDVNDQLMSLIFTLSADATPSTAVNSDNTFSTSNNNNDIQNFSQTIDRLKTIYAFNKSANSTSWITDSTNIFQSKFGQGTGVIEITNFTSLNTTINTELNSPGSFNLSIVDPYQSMVITEFDIEKALSDASNLFNNHKISQFGQQTSEQVINDLQGRLNQYRKQRNASSLTFQINANTLLGQRVTVILDRLGIELPFNFNSTSVSSITSGLAGGSSSGVTVAPEYLRGGAIAGDDGLDSNQTVLSSANVPQVRTLNMGSNSELAIFQQLIKAIFNKMTLDANSKNSLQQSNQHTNYARRKLRFNFLGKLIIQPMDPIHIYIGTQSKYDNKLLNGMKEMFSGLNYLQAVSGSLADTKKQLDTLFNPQAISVQVEKAAFVGSDFPNFLWSMVRPQFINEKEGTHVFGGLVENAVREFNDGKFVVNVRGNDNTAYLTMGKVNFKPGTDISNGVIYDPLTPFKSSFDTISSNDKDQTPTLLYENQVILGTSQDTSNPLVKFKLGPNAGRVAHSENYIQDRTADPLTKQIIKKFYAPDGLVYKWKEGIGTFVQFGSSLDLNNPTLVGNPSPTKDPFAGQDVMNVISLLITGVPYNFSTYWKTVSNFDGFGRDPHSQQDSAHSFYQSLRNDLDKRNTLWGNFIPFKNLTIDEASFAQTLNTTATIQNTNSQIQMKLQQLSDLENQAITAGLHATTATTGSSDPDIASRITSATTILNDQVTTLLTQLKAQDNASIIQTGSDVSVDSDQMLYKGDNKAKLADAATRRLLRRQVNFLTRRMSYNVRANEDKNLFIVDDSYDKDSDIAAFNSALDSDAFKLYNNLYLSVKDQIKVAADLLNLEVFCDTQGHIRVRSPQYNRVPSSIFYKMMYQKKALGVQIFPQFLDDLFNTQLKTLREKIELVEDQIRLSCAVLGQADDASAESFIIGSDASKNQGSAFAFISNSSGYIADIKDLINQASPDNQTNSSNNTFGTITGQATSTKNIFTSAQKYAFIQQSLKNANADPTSTNAFNISDISNFDTNLRINTLISRIETKSGQKINKSIYFFTTQNTPAPVFGIAPNQYIDVFKVTNDLSDQLSERKKAIKLFYSTIKNTTEFKSLDNNDNTANQLLLPGTYGNQNIPEVFEHMIEDESYDDYGPGSGKRYIIKNSQIKSYSIGENPPDYTSVEVQGTLNQFAPDGLPEGLNSFPGGGNALVTAIATDYDLWRNYGFRDQSPIKVPFLSDPTSQCAPYAASILSRARQNILRGSVTIAGNEYMQAGEVIFMEDMGLLFYVTSVRHSFTEGLSFTTTLDLSYGHAPGEYIPTPLDIIGKLLYNNKDTGGIQIQRQSSAFSEANYGVIILDPNSTTSSGVSGNTADSTNNTTTDTNGKQFQTFGGNQNSSTGNLGGSTYGPSNEASLNNILYNVAYMINANNAKSNNIKATVELRIYYDGKLSSGPDSDLESFTSYIQDLMTGAATASNSKDNIKVITLPVNSVIIGADAQIDLSSTDDSRSPSQKAWDAARNLVDSNSVSTDKTVTVTTGVTVPLGSPSIKTERDKLRKALFGYIVDCWVKFEVLPPTTPTTITSPSGVEIATTFE